MAAHLIDNEIFISDAHQVFPNRKIIKNKHNTKWEQNPNDEVMPQLIYLFIIYLSTFTRHKRHTHSLLTQVFQTFTSHNYVIAKKPEEQPKK